MKLYKLITFVFITTLFILTPQQLFAAKSSDSPDRSTDQKRTPGLIGQPLKKVIPQPTGIKIYPPINKPTTIIRPPIPSGILDRPINKPTTIIHPPKPSGTLDKYDKLRSCQAREANIKTRSENLTKFSLRLIETFDSISTKVQRFYTAKKLSVYNYSILVSDVARKKAAAQTAITKAQSVIISFNCTTGDPKVNLQTFNTNMKSVHKALNDYKTSVKNLVVAVHSSSSVDRSKDKSGNNLQIKVRN